MHKEMFCMALQEFFFKCFYSIYLEADQTYSEDFKKPSFKRLDKLYNPPTTFWSEMRIKFASSLS